jgi:hypothetical protein
MIITFALRIKIFIFFIKYIICIYIRHKDIGWGGMDWIDTAQDRDLWRALVNTAMNLRAPQNVGKFLSRCTIISFSRRVHLHGVRYLVSQSVG